MPLFCIDPIICHCCVYTLSNATVVWRSCHKSLLCKAPITCHYCLKILSHATVMWRSYMKMCICRTLTADSQCVMYFQWVTALTQPRLLTARWAVEMSTTCTDAAVSHATMARGSCVQCPSSSPVARWVCGTQTAQWTHSSSQPVGVGVQIRPQQPSQQSINIFMDRQF